MTVFVADLGRVVRSEMRVHGNMAVLLFILISLCMLVLGLAWPQKYTAAAVILVDQRKIIQPLTEGVAVPTEVKDFARIARDIIEGRKIMAAILEHGGWLKDGPSPVKQDRIIEDVKNRVRIASSDTNLFRIEYSDKDPVRSAQVADKLAELLLAESKRQKDEESGTAYAFLDQQVRAYHNKLLEAEARLKEFRARSVGAQPGTASEARGRIDELGAKLEQTRLDLAEALSREKSLQRQLAGETELSASLTRESQYQVRLAELQSQLQQLRLSFHDAHPDIVRVKHQMEDLGEAIIAEKRRRDAEAADTKDQRKSMAERGISINPLYEQLRHELSNTRTTIDTLRVRLAETEQLLKEESDRSVRIHAGEATLAELARDYEANRDLYQQLLKRREHARVSMNLDQAQQGLGLRIHEHAAVPLRPSGLRFIHFAGGGLILGILVPLGLLYLKMQYDPRVRFRSVIVEKLNLPLLAVIPHLGTAREERWAGLRMPLLGMMVALYLAAFAYISWLRFAGVLVLDMEDLLKAFSAIGVA